MPLMTPSIVYEYDSVVEPSPCCEKVSRHKWSFTDPIYRHVTKKR